VAMVRGSPNPRWSDLPARLRKARKQSGLTRAALGNKVGRAPEVAAYIESGQRWPTVATIALLASGLGISAAWLGYGIGTPSSDGPAATCDDMGARLQTVRVEQGHTKASLARLINVTPGTVADIENGGQAKVKTIEALADVLGVSPAWLAFNQGPQVLPSRRGGRPRSQPADLAG